jgi:hypothetical protein
MTKSKKARIGVLAKASPAMAQPIPFKFGDFLILIIANVPTIKVIIQGTNKEDSGTGLSNDVNTTIMTNRGQIIPRIKEVMANLLVFII